jgi:hypothetical protein
MYTYRNTIQLDREAIRIVRFGEPDDSLDVKEEISTGRYDLTSRKDAHALVDKFFDAVEKLGGKA